MPNPKTAPPDDKEMGVAKAGPCPYGRSLHYHSMEYTIDVGWDELTEIIDMIDDLWMLVETEHKPPSERVGEHFGSLLNHVTSLREWTGWGGVPGKYLGGNDV